MAPILALDLGKYKTVACVYHSDAEHHFRSVTTSKADLAELLDEVRPRVVLIEACALSGWVHDLCVEQGVECVTANTASEAWKFKNTKRKTDRDDARRLASLYVLGQLPAVNVPTKAVRDWRALIAHRQRLVGRRVALQNKLRATLLAQGLPAPRGAKAWSETGLAGIGQFAKPLGECSREQLWQGQLDLTLTEYRQVVELIVTIEATLDPIAKANVRTQLLDTIPGVGPRTAEVVVAYLDDPRRFASGKQVSAYAGLVPRQYQSGESDRRGRITRRGPGIVRKLLVECAWCALRYNAWARAVYARLSHGGKSRKKQAVVALARKLLVRCWAMLRDNKPWRTDPVPGAVAA
jgi:transposase